VQFVIVLDDEGGVRGGQRTVNGTYSLDVFDFPFQLLVFCLVLGILSASSNTDRGLLLSEPQVGSCVHCCRQSKRGVAVRGRRWRHCGHKSIDAVCMEQSRDGGDCWAHGAVLSLPHQA